MNQELSFQKRAMLNFIICTIAVYIFRDSLGLTGKGPDIQALFNANYDPLSDPQTTPAIANNYARYLLISFYFFTWLALTFTFEWLNKKSNAYKYSAALKNAVIPAFLVLILGFLVLYWASSAQQLSPKHLIIFAASVCLFGMIFATTLLMKPAKNIKIENPKIDNNGN